LTGIRVSSLTKKSICISNDIIAVLPPYSPKSIKLFDLSSGKPLNNSIEHQLVKLNFLNSYIFRNLLRKKYGFLYLDYILKN